MRIFGISSMCVLKNLSMWETLTFDQWIETIRRVIFGSGVKCPFEDNNEVPAWALLPAILVMCHSPEWERMLHYKYWAARLVAKKILFSPSFRAKRDNLWSFSFNYLLSKIFFEKDREWVITCLWAIWSCCSCRMPQWVRTVWGIGIIENSLFPPSTKETAKYQF